MRTRLLPAAARHKPRLDTVSPRWMFGEEQRCLTRRFCRHLGGFRRPGVVRFIPHAGNFHVFLTLARRQRRSSKNRLAHPAAHELIGDARTLRHIDRRFRGAGGRLCLQRADKNEDMDRHLTLASCAAFAIVALVQCEAWANRCGGGATAACDLLPLPPSG